MPGEPRARGPREACVRHRGRGCPCLWHRGRRQEGEGARGTAHRLHRLPAGPGHAPGRLHGGAHGHAPRRALPGLRHPARLHGHAALRHGHALPGVHRAGAQPHHAGGRLQPRPAGGKPGGRQDRQAQARPRGAQPHEPAHRDGYHRRAGRRPPALCHTRAPEHAERQPARLRACGQGGHGTAREVRQGG